MNKRFFAELGEISSGTLRTEDLMPRFMSELETLTDLDEDPRRREAARKVIQDISLRQGDWAEDANGSLVRYYEAQYSDWDMDLLYDALQMYAPDGCYFGSHEGDGAAIGFWYHADL